MVNAQARFQYEIFGSVHRAARLTHGRLSWKNEYEFAPGLTAHDLEPQCACNAFLTPVQHLAHLARQ